MLMKTHKSRLDALRKELRAQALDGFVIPISDEHMSEYVGAYAQRLAWLTGFGGSAASVVVLTDETRDPAAAIFVDGRYTLQVRDQVDGDLYTYENVPETSPAKWLSEQAGKGARIGFDPWLHGKRWASAAHDQLAKAGAELVAVSANPVDAIWADQPAPSDAAAIIHDERFAGQSSAAKRAQIADWLKDRQLDAAIVSALDSIAWLFNIRGSDIDRTPVTLSFAIIHADARADLFITPGKVSADLRAHLGDDVRIAPRQDFETALSRFAEKRVGVDPDSNVQAIFTALEQANATLVEASDPCILPKATKNAAEQQGHRDAQARDGAAVCRFLHWLSVEGPSGTVTEMSASDRLHQFRRDTGDLRDLSFDTISGSGPNGAIVHYRVTDETSRVLEPGSVYLVDSGGQYPDGTTDITRTVWIGTPEETDGAPPDEVKDRYTRVLKGNIALAQAVFPADTRGSQLDVLARQFLWDAGLDYAHGTGHGVGSFLSVHEGPQRIAKPSRINTGAEPDLQPGMILSNEPGYYKAGEYGIRIENLQLVEKRDIAGAEGEFLGFETLTLVPIDRTLVNFDQLTPGELAWWNAYHARVLDVIGPQLDGEALAWLKTQCAPVS